MSSTWATTHDSGADLELGNIWLVVVSHWHALLLILFVGPHVGRIVTWWQLVIASSLVLRILSTNRLANIELVRRITELRCTISDLKWLR